MHHVSWLSALVLLAFFAGACGVDDNPAQIASTPESTTISDPALVGQSVRGVIPQPTTSRKIVFSWTEGDPIYRLSPGIVIWRQQAGILRIDGAHQGSDNPKTGEFAILASAASGDARTCTWTRVVPSGTDARTNCVLFETYPDRGPAPAVAAILDATIQAALANRIISGMNADCYEVSDEGTLCLGVASRLPLYISALNPLTSVRQTLEAISEAPLTQTDLATHPVDGVDVPPSALALPEEFRLSPFDDPLR
ncbi:MAG TPA: hypothetical protein VIH21_04425 [Dehalococcoidia bacterium]